MAHGRRASWKERLLLVWTDLPMALKMTLCLVPLASLVLIVTWLVSSSSVEYVVSSLVAALPDSTWLAPPYLFLTVHFIILLIWKLSDHKPQGQGQGQGHPLPVPVPKHNIINLSVPAAAPAPSPSPVVQQSYYQWHPQQQDNLSHDDASASCTTDDSTSDHHNSTATSSPPLLIRRNERPPPPASPPEQPKEEEEGEIDGVQDDSMDATWRAIMAKTSRAPAAATNAKQAIEPEMSAAEGADEMNQRFEEFIKKSRDQIRLQAGHA